ncbi:hypothetical protein, partial [Nocardia seriolae]|uniref:hypothetical protein n=1 Tax=Nocardia seriolae TaxID=37332 RepID=UPI001E636C0E
MDILWLGTVSAGYNRSVAFLDNRYINCAIRAQTPMSQLRQEISRAGPGKQRCPSAIARAGTEKRWYYGRLSAEALALSASSSDSVVP